MANALKVALAAVVTTVVAGCSAFPFNLGGAHKAAVQQGQAALAKSGAVALSGLVEWPESPSSSPKTQALASNVVSQATVALIDHITGETVATTLSDNTGTFTLTIPGFSPVPSPDFYTLEAVKGANNQSPGSGTLRLRSIVEWNGGWVSCTNAVAGSGTIAINNLTTALALEVGLTRASVTDVLGAADDSSPPDLLKSPINATVSGAEVIDLEGAVTGYILNNLDPVSQTSQISPQITSVSPMSGVVGDVVAINGSGFVSVPGATTVLFNGVTAPIVAVTPTTIFTTVPAQALGGPITVTTLIGSATGPTFTIPNSSTVAINMFAPNPTSVGSVLSIGGQGFVLPAGNNTVTFACVSGAGCSGGRVQGTVQSGDTHSLGVVIPQDAVSGAVQVSNAFGASSNVWLSISLTGTPVVNDAFPNEGTDNQDVYLEGTLFGRTQGTVTFTDVTGKTFGAIIRQWRDNMVRVTVPWQVQPGAATIAITNSSNLTATTPWTVLTGTLNWAGTQLVTQLPNQTGTDMLGAWSDRNLYIVGGGGSSEISQLALNADGSPGAVTANVAQMPITIGGPDFHQNFGTWQGDRFWAFDNNGTTSKAYLQFDQNGNYVSTNIIGPAFALLDGQPFFQHDTAITCGPKGCYMAGADESTSAAALNEIYEIFNPQVDSIGPWQSIPLGGGNAFQDAAQLVLGNNLWLMGGCCGTIWGSVQVSSPLEPDGTPTGMKYWGVSPTGGHIAFIEPVGNTLYAGLGDSATVYSDPLLSGSYPQDYTGVWPTMTSISSYIGCLNQMGHVVIGGYLYLLGNINWSGCPTVPTNAVYAVPIS